MSQTSAQATIQISDADLTTAHEQSFFVFKDVCPQDELERIQGEYDYLFANEVGKEEGNYFDLGGTDEEGAQRVLPQILGPLNYMEWVHDSVYAANCREIARRLLNSDEEILGFGSHAILKPANYGLVTPWHQDKAYWGYGTEPRNINFWMPLEDATVESGCLHYIPGSHKLPGQNGFDVLEHQSINNDPRIHGMELSPFGETGCDLSTAVAAPCMAGDVVIHFPRSLHFAQPNSTDHDRRALIIGCGISALETGEEIGDYPWQVEKKTLREERAAKFNKQDI